MVFVVAFICLKRFQLQNANNKYICINQSTSKHGSNLFDYFILILRRKKTPALNKKCSKVNDFVQFIDEKPSRFYQHTHTNHILTQIELLFDRSTDKEEEETQQKKYHHFSPLSK